MAAARGRRAQERGIFYDTFFPFFATFGSNLPAKFLQYETVGASRVGYEVSYTGNVTPCSMVLV